MDNERLCGYQGKYRAAGAAKKGYNGAFAFPLTDKIFGKSEITDNGVAPPQPTTPLRTTCSLFFFIF